MDVLIEYLSCGCVIWLSGRAVTGVSRDGIQFQCPRCRQVGIDVVARETRTVEAVAAP
jgi:hypothetical protein